MVLTKPQAALVERLVESGRYQNTSEVLREGLRLIESLKAQGETTPQSLVRSRAHQDTAQKAVTLSYSVVDRHDDVQIMEVLRVLQMRWTCHAISAVVDC